MKVGIYTISETLFEAEAAKVLVRTENGELTILDNHIPLITTLIKAPVKIFDAAGTEHSFDLASGVLEVRPESNVVILAHSV